MIWLSRPFLYHRQVDPREARIESGARERLHWSFPDPSRVEGEGRTAAFRQVRDEIRARIEGELIGATGLP
jgi:protein-tyrosine-phosphatase